jgi:glycosyltransferase involved in cell wall biosynthesis
LKVVVSTAGRFHLFALARELERRDCLERIYSGFIWSALARESVSRDKVTTFPWFRTPYMALGRMPVAPRAFSRWLETMSYVAQDAYVARRLPDCDAFIGHDGAGLVTGREAKRRGLRYVADTGTTHVAFRAALLKEEFTSYGLEYRIDNETIHWRQIEEYEAADVVVVPSEFVKQSFVRQGFPAEKLRVIPYGVRTTHFHRVSRPPDDRFRVLFVGALSIRKGARYLFQAFRELPHPRKELVIVGTVRDEVRPLAAEFRDLNVKFVGVVPNMKLKHLYSSSHAFVLPSVEEGLGMVLAEAMACGCPVIASANTGAAELFSCGREGFIVPARDSRAIRDCLTRLADEPELRERMSAAAIERVKSLGGWSAYGDAYANLLRRMAEDSGRLDVKPGPCESALRPKATRTNRRRQPSIGSQR